MDDRYTRLDVKDFTETPEKHPETIPELARKMKVTETWVIDALKEGRFFDNGYGGYIIK